jgi:DNA-binding CsgD family transcriptional regulator
MRCGVRHRALLDLRALTAPNMQGDVRASMAEGQEIRVVDTVPVKMMIVDGETAMLPLWPGSEPDEVVEVHPGDLDDVDRQVLALLLSGLTDQALAGQLDMSLRTVHRRIRQLMVKAGVTSRIQLGWAAVSQGLGLATPTFAGRTVAVSRGASRGSGRNAPALRVEALAVR